MFFVWKLFKGARATAAWTSLAGAASLVGWATADHLAHRHLGKWILGTWFIVSLLVALVAGVISIPRWQALVGIAVAIGALVLLIR